jgi:polar amino acid transport system substrate-binding protein
MWLLQGMPMVVLLMVLYYIIFGNTSLSGMAISIVGFSLTFGVAVFGMLKTAVAAVDSGQYEAACALGYTPRRTFFRIILPQALPFMTEPYRGEIISLIKATSIVGYIAVLDLAKMGDLVRSRTYEAFFPLIAVMLIYFILEGILGTLVRVITDRLDPRKRKNGLLLKGVKEHD